MLFDVNAFLGGWPFNLLAEQSPAQLADYLAASGIHRAAVSHLGAVFQPEPMPANRRLFAAVRRERSLIPVPVVNPLLANWREQLGECRKSADVRAVRLIPNYHNYALGSARMDEFMAAIAVAGLRVVLTVRLEDERQRYFALKVRGVPTGAVAKFLRQFPRHHVLCTSLSVNELLKLTGECANFSADLSYAENIALARMLHGKIPARRLMFGTLAPMMSARAQAAKLTADAFTGPERTLIGAGNARRFFCL